MQSDEQINERMYRSQSWANASKPNRAAFSERVRDREFNADELAFAWDWYLRGWQDRKRLESVL